MADQSTQIDEVDKNEELFKINGQNFTKTQLYQTFYKLSCGHEFSIKQFSVIAIYHLIKLVFSPVGAIVVISIFEKFYLSILYNMQILVKKDDFNFIFIIDFASKIALTLSFYKIYFWSKDEKTTKFNFWDYFHIFML